MPKPRLFDAQALHAGKGGARTLGTGSLLELAENRGLTTEFSCPGGSYGTYRPSCQREMAC